LIDAVHAPAKVLLFDWHARGDTNKRNDFDSLVIEREIGELYIHSANRSVAQMPGG
jgi:hypothetical protein